MTGTRSHTISITTPINPPPPPGVAIRTAIGNQRKSGVMTGRIIGQNNFTGNYIATDSATRYNVNTSISQHQNNEGVSLGRSGRDVHVLSYTSRIATGPGQRSLTSNKNIPGDIDACDSGGSGGAADDAPQEPEKPKEPEPPKPPEEPAPEDPEKPPEEPAPSEGCYPESDCQWYNSDSSSPSGCPSGTTYKGFAELNDGFKLLCCGPDRPAGDGCPEDPASYGWSCVGGACALVPNGIYATQGECEGNCEPLPEEPPPPPDEPGPEPEEPMDPDEPAEVGCSGVLYFVDYTVESLTNGEVTGTGTYEFDNVGIPSNQMLGPVVYEGRVETTGSGPAGLNTALSFPISFNGVQGYLNLFGANSRWIGTNIYGDTVDYRVTNINIYPRPGEPDCP